MMNKSNDFQRNKKKYDEHKSIHSTQFIAHSEWNPSAYFSMFAELSAISYHKYENNSNRQLWNSDGEREREKKKAEKFSMMNKRVNSIVNTM